MFTEKDLHQIEQHGLTREAVERQIENFRRGFPFLKVVRAASPGDGVVVVDDAVADAAQARYEQAAHGLSVVKFVPASGAATRMFKELFEFVNEGKRGKGIDTLHGNYEKAMKQLSTGTGNLVSRAQRLAALNVKISRSLPKTLTEEADDTPAEE